jgi:hypothetical protein
LGVIGATLNRFGSDDLYRFVFYLVLSGLAAGLKVSLPGIRGTMSVCFLFVFIGIADLSASEAMIIGCAGHGGAMPLEAKAAAQGIPGDLQHREHRNRG